MKKVIIILSVIIVGIIAFYLIHSWQLKQNIYSKEFVDKFERLDGKNQMDFFNSLNKQERMKFMSEFMKNRIFGVRPVEIVKFYSDGEFISDMEAEDVGMVGGNGKDKTFKYFVGKWNFKDGLIFIDSPNSKNNIFGKNVVLDDVSIYEYDSNGQTSHFIFHILKGEDHKGKNLANRESDLWGGTTSEEAETLSSAIASYTKLKNSKKQLKEKK
jgi:hypothetical protein